MTKIEEILENENEVKQIFDEFIDMKDYAFLFKSLSENKGVFHKDLKKEFKFFLSNFPKLPPKFASLIDDLIREKFGPRISDNQKKQLILNFFTIYLYSEYVNTINFLRHENRTKDISHLLKLNSQGVSKNKNIGIKAHYEAKIDSKKRLTIRGSTSKYFTVNEYEDGTVELKPLMVLREDEMSKNTLLMINDAMINLKKGIASEPIDFDSIKIDEDID